MVDGFDNNQPFTGAVAATFSQDAVREFQVLAAAFPAEFGDASGGIVNTVTRSGTNELHGSAFFFLRDDALNAKAYFEKNDVFGNPIDAPKAPFHQAQWGATLGGPLRKDRTFFFLSYEQFDVDANNFVTIDAGVADILGRNGFPVELGSVPYEVATKSALAKLDHNFGPTHRLLLRGHFSRGTNENIEPFGGIVARSHGLVQLHDRLGHRRVADRRVRLGLRERGPRAGREPGQEEQLPRSQLRRALRRGRPGWARNHCCRGWPWPDGSSTSPVGGLELQHRA